MKRKILTSPLTYFLIALGAAACTGNLGAEPPDASGDVPCEGAACNAECVEDAECADGFFCNASGACEQRFNAGNGSSGSGGDPPDVCADVQVTFDPVTPNVVLLIDQSGSMSASYPGGNRWDVLYDALMNPADGVVKTLEQDVRFGLALYTSFNGNEGGAECPVLTEVTLSMGDGTHASIDAVYSQADPEDETPTGESLAMVADALAAQQMDGPRIVILATDGEPRYLRRAQPAKRPGRIDRRRGAGIHQRHSDLRPRRR